MSASGTGRGAAGGGGRGFWLALGLVTVLFALAFLLLSWYFNRSAMPEAAPIATAAADSVPPVVSRGAILVFPAADGRGHVTEQRQLPAGVLPEQEVAALLDALAAGPTRADAVAPLPPASRVRVVFRDPGGTDLVVDWSSDLLTGIPGGSSWEEAVLDCILRTLALNFPRVRHCTLLVDGAPVTTLAGHLALDRPFDMAAWR